MTRDELAAKADWDGGLPECIFGGILKHTDLPASAPTEIKQAWKRLEEAKRDMDFVGEWLFR